MSDVEQLKETIRQAFAQAQRPADGALHESAEGEEPRLLEQDFRGKDDWRTLDAAFLDQAPDGYSSALSFFSREALRYFLPAYLIADLDGGLDRVDVAYRICAPFSNAAAAQKVNPQRYGDLTRLEAGRRRFSALSREEAGVVAAWLSHKAATDEANRELIREAIANYWQERRSS
jgi:hypothetical protein